MWITPIRCGKPPSRRGAPCGRLAVVHRTVDLSTLAIHYSSTARTPRHLQQYGLSTGSTGPTTTIKSKSNGFSPEYLGMAQLRIDTRTRATRSRAGQQPGVGVRGPGALMSVSTCV